MLFVGKRSDPSIDIDDHWTTPATLGTRRHAYAHRPALAPACSTPATRRPPPISVIPSSAVGAPHSHPLSLSLCPMTAIPSSLTTHYGRFLAATHSLTTPVTPPATFNMDYNRKEYQDRLIVCSQRIIERAKFYTATLPSGFMRSSSHTQALQLLAHPLLAHTI